MKPERRYHEVKVRVRKERKKPHTTETIEVLSPPKAVKNLGGAGQEIFGGLPLHALLNYRNGDVLRLTIEKMPKTGTHPISPADALQRIFEELYVQEVEGVEMVNPDKEWTSSTAEDIATVLSLVISRPTTRFLYLTPPREK